MLFQVNEVVLTERKLIFADLNCWSVSHAIPGSSWNWLLRWLIPYLTRFRLLLNDKIIAGSYSENISLILKTVQWDINLYSLNYPN